VEAEGAAAKAWQVVVVAVVAVVRNRSFGARSSVEPVDQVVGRRKRDWHRSAAVASLEAVEEEVET
jgi:hypothetical protein